MRADRSADRTLRDALSDRAQYALRLLTACKSRQFIATALGVAIDSPELDRFILDPMVAGLDYAPFEPGELERVKARAPLGRGGDTAKARAASQASYAARRAANDSIPDEVA